MARRPAPHRAHLPAVPYLPPRRPSPRYRLQQPLIKGRSTLPLNLIKEGYTPKDGYDKAIKVEKILKMQEQVDVAMSQTLQESQADEKSGKVDLHALSREQNDKITEDVFGPPKKARCRFRGSEPWTYYDTISSKPMMPSSMQRPDEAQAVYDLLARAMRILVYKLQPTNLAIVVPLMYAGIGSPPQLWNITKHIVVCLAGKIPDDMLRL